MKSLDEKGSSCSGEFRYALSALCLYNSWIPWLGEEKRSVTYRDSDNQEDLETFLFNPHKKRLYVPFNQEEK